MDKLLLDKLREFTKEEKLILKGESVDPEIFSGKSLSVISKNRIHNLGQQISLSQHYRFTEIPNHGHEYIEFCYVCSGSLIHRINDENTIEVKAGELLLLNHSTYHSIEKSSEEDIAVNFLVLPEFFDTTMAAIGSGNLLGDFLIDAVSGKNGDISFLHFKVSDIKTIQNLVENLISNTMNINKDLVKVEKFTMALLFLELLKYSERMRVASLSGVESLVFQVLGEMEENYANLSLSDIAIKNHVSLSYISRVIKEKTGKSFKDLLLEKRLSVAKELLLTTKIPVSQIAEIVGYDNKSFFHRKFKECFGESPRKIRIDEFS